MWKKKIKNKEAQFVLIGVILFVIAAILSMCLSFTMELKSFAGHALTKENCPDAFIVAIDSQQLSAEITDDQARQLIQSESAITGKEISVPVVFHEENIALYNQMMLSAKDYQDWGYLWLSEGEEDTPAEDEVWIAKKIAVSQGIQIGDTITLAYDEPVTLRVSGIYKAGFAPSVSNAFAPIVVNEKLLERHSHETDSAIFAVQLKNYSIENCHQLADHYPYSRQLLTRDMLQNQIVVFAALISSFGAIAVFIVFFLALLVIRFIVRNNITREFRDIGIYKSLGYQSGQIKGFYLKGYVAVGTVTIFLGTLGSFPLNYYLGRVCTECLDGYHITILSFISALFVTAVLLLILILNVQFALKKVDEVTPVKAISVGVTMHEGKISKSVIRYAKKPWEMAVNDIFKNKRASIVIIIVFTMSLCLCMLFSKFVYTFSNAEKVASRWFAIPQSNVYLSGAVSDELFEYIDQNDMVETEAHGYMSYVPSVTSDQFPDAVFCEVKLDIFHDTSEAKTGVPMMRGKHPGRSDEIAVTCFLADMLGVKPGDYIQLTIQNTKKEYLITGTYFSLFSQQGIMLTEEAMKEVEPSYHTHMGFVTLKDSADFEAFREDLLGRYKGVCVDRHWFTMENSISTIKSMIVTVSTILIVVFFLFFMINTMIVLLMEHTNKHVSYGVLKSLGFTSNYMIQQVTDKFMILGVLSGILASAVHVFVTNTVLSQIVPGGFMEPKQQLLLIFMVFLGLIVLLNRIIGRTIRKITVVELMEE